VALAIGFFLAACGPPPAPPPPPPLAAERPSAVEGAEDAAKPKETLVRFENKAGRDMPSALNEHDAQKLAGFYADKAILRLPGAAADVTGRDAVERAWTRFFQAFPDIQTKPLRVWGKGDAVMVEWMWSAVQTGDFWGIKGKEKQVGTRGLDILWFNADGEVKEHHVYFDGATLLTQIGFLKGKARPIKEFPEGDPQFFASVQELPDETRNVELARSFFATFDARREADFAAALADDVEYDDITKPDVAKGKSDTKKLFKELTTAFPDMRTNVANVWGIEDFVILERRWTGTQKGPFLGNRGTKKTASTSSAEIVQLKDGKVVRVWSYANAADALQQLGHVTLPRPGAREKPPDKPKPRRKKPASDDGY
jgi:steroid delta-isomerase-like uncharacterized protein